jgi:hypothetical protein
MAAQDEEGKSWHTLHVLRIDSWEKTNKCELCATTKTMMPCFAKNVATDTSWLIATASHTSSWDRFLAIIL